MSFEWIPMNPIANDPSNAMDRLSHSEQRRLELFKHRLQEVVCMLNERRESMEALSASELIRLEDLNSRLQAVEAICLNEARRMERIAQARVENPSDAMYDFEIEAVLSCQLREDDAEWSSESDNEIITRTYSLRGGSRLFCTDRDWGLADCDWRMPRPICWLMRDIHVGIFGNTVKARNSTQQAGLSLSDLLRIGTIYLDIQFWHQWKLEAEQ